MDLNDFLEKNFVLNFYGKKGLDMNLEEPGSFSDYLHVVTLA